MRTIFIPRRIKRAIARARRRLLGDGRHNLVIALARNEAPYLLEWIAYQLTIGFRHILIVTNDNSDETLAILHKLARAPFIDVIEHRMKPGKPVGLAAHKLALAWLHRHGRFDHVLVCDIDEYLVLRAAPDIGTFIRGFPHADGIVVNWRVYGSSGLTRRGEGLSIENYTQRARDDFVANREFKTLFRYTPDIISLGTHFPRYRRRLPRYVHADGMRVDARVFLERPYTLNSRLPVEPHAWLNHYVIRSREEFDRKKRRGQTTRNSNRVRHDEEFFRRMDRNDVEDDHITSRAEAVRRRMRELYDTYGLADVVSREVVGLPRED